MLQRIESAQKQRLDVARDWIDRLHQFAHVDQLVLRAVIVERDGGLFYRLGPYPLELPFRFCTAEAISVMAAQLEALDNFLRLIGRPPIAGLPAYLGKVAAWQLAHARAFAAHASAFEPDPDDAGGDARAG